MTRELIKLQAAVAGCVILESSTMSQALGAGDRIFKPSLVREKEVIRGTEYQ
jgi:hypothetical protein